MFYRTDLTNLPDKLLAYNPKLTDLNSAFNACPRMKLSAGIFIDPASNWVLLAVSQEPYPTFGITLMAGTVPTVRQAAMPR